MATSGDSMLITIGKQTINVALVILRGVVIKLLWTWFAVPLGIIPIGVLEAVGLSMLVGVLTFQIVPMRVINEINADDWLERTVFYVLLYVVVIVLGFGVHFLAG